MDRFQPTNFQTQGDFITNLSGFTAATTRIAQTHAARKEAEDTEEARKAKGEYITGIKNDSIEMITRASLEFPDDEKGFDNKIGEASQALLASVPEEYKADVTGLFGTLTTSARTKIMAAESNRLKGEQFAEAEATSESFRSLVFNAARSGEPHSDLLNEAFINLDQMVESRLIDSTAAGRQKREIQREATEQALRFELESTAASDGVSEAMSDLDEIEPPATWEPDQWDTFKRGVRADLVRKQSQDKAQEVQARNLAKVAVKEYVDAVGTGFPVSPQEKARVQGMATGFPALEKSLGLVEDLAAFSLTSFDDREAMINAGQTGNLEDSAEFAGMVSANSKINKMAQEDAYTLGVNQGVIDMVDFVPSDPSTLEERVLQAEALSDHYGVQASPLTDGEITTLTNSLPVMTVPEKVALAETLSIAPNLWGDISKKGGGTFAMAGATGDANIMGQVFKGQEMLDNKLAVPLKASDFLADFNDSTAGVYGTEDAMNLKNAVLAYYATTGETEYDSSTFEEALQAVSGGIVDINGFKVEQPRGVDPDVFEDFIDDMHPETVAQMGGIRGMTDDEAAETIRRSRLVGVKSGAYTVESDFGTLLNPDGTTFILEWDDNLAEMNSLRKKRDRIASTPNPRGQR